MPVALVDEDLVYKFGTLPHLYEGKHTWTFKNTGAGKLELRGAKKTCSCTTAALFGANDEKQVTVEPGTSMPIEVTFKTKIVSEKWSQEVTVGTNDPARPTIVLRVEGAVQPAILTVPPDPSMGFGIVSNEDEVSRKIALYSVDRPDLQVLKVTSSNPSLLDAIARPMTPEEMGPLKVTKGFAIVVTLKPSSNLGAFAEEILVETDHPMKSEVRFKVAGKVTGIMSVLPEKVSVRGANAVDGGLENLKILVRGRSTVAFTVEKKPAGLDLAIEPITLAPGAKGSQYKLVAKVPPGTEAGRIVDEIILKTDDPKVTELKIPVDVIVQGPR